MTNTLQKYLAAATKLAATELAEAFISLPEDKRLWCPAETSRSATDQLAECALFNGYMASLYQTRKWPDNYYDVLFSEKDDLVAQGWQVIHPTLVENTARAAAAIAIIPDSDLPQEIETIPHGSRTLSQMIGSPYWNMTYHFGQISYIASLLGLLE